jgi:hypothetical protein
MNSAAVLMTPHCSQLAPTNVEYKLALADALLRAGESASAEQHYTAAGVLAAATQHRAGFSCRRRADIGVRQCTQARVLSGKLERYLKEGNAGFAGHTAAELQLVCPEMVLAHRPPAAAPTSAARAAPTKGFFYKCVSKAGVAYRNSPAMADRYEEGRGPEHMEVRPPASPQHPPPPLATIS